jgi:TRAP-type transport system small permease protein
MQVSATVAQRWRVLEIAMNTIMAVLLFAMMTITAVDVFGRYVLNSPVPGGFELVQYLMAVVIFASLPLTTAAERHLSVSLVGGRLRGRWRNIHRAIVLSVSFIALAVISWRMALQAETLVRSKQVSGYLQLPLGPIAWMMAALATLAAVIAFAKLCELVLRRDSATGASGPQPGMD